MRLPTPERPHVYQISLTITAADDGAGLRIDNAFMDEKCARDGDVRRHRRALLEALIAEAQSALADEGRAGRRESDDE